MNPTAARSAQIINVSLFRPMDSRVRSTSVLSFTRAFRRAVMRAMMPPVNQAAEGRFTAAPPKRVARGL
jgi:hypothetical protein